MRNIKIEGKPISMEYQLEKLLKDFLRQHKKMFEPQEEHHKSVSMACTLIDVFTFLLKEEKIKLPQMCEIVFAFLDIIITNMFPQELTDEEIKHMEEYFKASKLFTLGDFFKKPELNEH